MPSPGRKRFPNCLRKFRKIRGLEQTDVALILGFKNSTKISKWENGLCMPSLPNLFRLAAAYRTMVDPLYPDLFEQCVEEVKRGEKKIESRKSAPPGEGKKNT